MNAWLRRERGGVECWLLVGGQTGGEKLPREAGKENVVSGTLKV